MSMNKILITTAIAALGVASVSTAASAQNSRYGDADVYDYESSADCNVDPCAGLKAPVKSSRYGGEYVEQAPMQVAPGPVYVDCQQMGTCGPQVMSQPTTVYTQPAQPMYQQAAPAPSYAQAPANCPAGTTGQPDGTCMQTGSSSTYSGTSSYGSTSNYSGYDVVIDSAPAAPMMPVNCPAGTTAQNDGTCMQTGSSYGSSSTYSSSTSATLPGTYGSSSTYSGDAAPTTTSSQTYGYTSDGAYTASDYLPIRK